MANVSYKRVSSTDQKDDRQLDGQTFDKEFSDKASAGTTNRPGLKSCLEFIREGDTLHVHSIDRLCRNLADLQGIVTDLTGKGIAINFHKENLLFTGKKNPMNNLMMQLLGAVAEFEKALINERQKEGIAKARADGKHLGRRPSLTADQVAEIRGRIAAGEQVADLAEEHGVSRQTIYQSLKRNGEKVVSVNNRIHCKICGARVHYVGQHLYKAHPGVTKTEYRREFPEAPIMSEKARKTFELRSKQAQAPSEVNAVG